MPSKAVLDRMAAAKPGNEAGRGLEHRESAAPAFDQPHRSKTALVDFIRIADWGLRYFLDPIALRAAIVARHRPRLFVQPLIAKFVEPQPRVSAGTSTLGLSRGVRVKRSDQSVPPSSLGSEARQNFLCHSSQASASAWARR